MSEITTALAALKTIVKTISVTSPPGDRVWVMPTDGASITPDTLPIVIISKMNTEPGSWETDSFGAGKHEWDILVAVYIAAGPIQVTNSDEYTLAAITNASEWYKALSDLLFANLTLSGTVTMVGDADGKMFDYITDNIIWDGRQYYGHLFVIPVTQKILQGVSA